MFKDRSFKIIIFLMAFLIFNFTFLIESHAAFKDLGCGARPIGMGGAFCAIANDANAFMYNPAGLTQIKQIQVSAMYATLYPGLSDRSNIANNFLAVAVPMQEASIGIAWFNLSGISDPERTNAGYQENSYMLAYARKISNVSFGLSLKMLSKEYSENEWTKVNPVFATTRSASAFSMDLGLLYKPNKKWNIGLCTQDVNQPDMGIDTTSLVPMNIKLGLGYNFEPFWKFNDITGAVDVAYRSGEYKVYTGLEGWLMARTIGIRVGASFGRNNFSNIACGASYQLTEEVYNNEFRLDYGFSYPLSGMQPTGGTHRISLTIGFGLQ